MAERIHYPHTAKAKGGTATPPNATGRYRRKARPTHPGCTTYKPMFGMVVTWEREGRSLADIALLEQDSDCPHEQAAARLFLQRNAPTEVRS